MPLHDGDFYINNSNQDFWLRENGVWVRKGNIRDDGSTGLVGVVPNVSLGFDLGAQVDRIRFLGTLSEDMGVSMAAVVDRIRLLVANPGLGFLFNPALTVDRISALGAVFNLGLSEAAAITGTSVLIDITASMALGFSQASLLNRVNVLGSVAPNLGFNESAAVSILKAVAAAPALGFSVSATVLRTRLLTVAYALGFSEAAALTLTASLVTHTPSAVSTSFTYTGIGNPSTPLQAGEAHLYDGNDLTAAADPIALNTSTHANYDLGSAFAITNVRIITAQTFGYGGPADLVMDIGFADSTLTGTYTSSGSSITITPGTSVLVNKSFASVGAHRYWRVFYTSGTTGANVWFGELSFQS